jgi:hypothetical protein
VPSRASPRLNRQTRPRLAKPRLNRRNQQSLNGFCHALVKHERDFFDRPQVNIPSRAAIPR